MESPAVAIDGLIKRYGSTLALGGLSLIAQRGAVTAVLGRNGAGKTTAIEICEGLRTFDGGSVTVLGRRPDDPTLRSRVGVMPQTGGSYQTATVQQLLDLFASFYAQPLSVADLLERLDLAPLRKRLVKRLSGGQAQRLSLALAIVGRPELVFLDEPTANLDVHARNGVWELVRELRAAGVSVVLTTHNMQEAEALADAVAIIEGGALLAHGAPSLLAGSRGSTVSFRAASLEGLQLPAAMHARLMPDGRYVVEGATDSRALAIVSSALADADIRASDIHLGSGGLEEVFLALTGESA